MRAERQREWVSGPLGFGTLAVGPERGVRERLGSRERVGRGWTEREVWAEPVWRGLGRSVGELGRPERETSWAAGREKRELGLG